MLQFIFVFPLIYKVVHDHKEHGLAICFGVNMTYELLQRVYLMNEECYRLLLFRYIFLIAYGCYLALGENRIKRGHYAMAVIIGVSYILLTQYAGIRPFVEIYWAGTSCMACLWILPMAAVMIQQYKFTFAPLEILGRSSYHIFLIQKLYYYFGAWVIYDRLNSRMLQILTSLLLCCFVGVVFYYIETRITKYIVGKIVI